MTARILVVGGAGYIGSHVVLALKDAGIETAVLDDLSSGCRENLCDDVPFYEASILSPGDLEPVFRDFEPTGLIHLAALKAAGESMRIPMTYAHHNMTGFLNLMKCVLDFGVTRFIFSSSAAVYGAPMSLPIVESHPTEPTNFYGFTKLEVERFLKWYAQLKHVRYASLRYFNAAGYDVAGRVRGLEANPLNLLPIVMEVAMKWREHLDVFGADYRTRDGTCLRDYIHVTDLADAHVRALAALDDDPEIICNLGTGRAYSVLEVLDAARKLTGRVIPHRVVDRRPGDPAELWASSDKAKELLNWRAEVSDLEQLVKSTWAVYRDVRNVPCKQAT